MSRHKRAAKQRHQQRVDRQWTATADAQRAAKMRDDIVHALGHPLFRSARRRSAIAEVKDVLALADETRQFSADDLRDYYEELFARPVETLDETTIGDLISSLTERQTNAMRIAEVFVIAPAMHRVVVAATATIDAEDLKTLTRDDIAWETGFLVFPHTVQIGDSRGWADVEAITWHVAAARNGAPTLGIHYWSRWDWQQHIPGPNPKPWPTTIQIPLDQTQAATSCPIPHEAFRSGTPQPGWTAQNAMAEAGPDNEYNWICESGPTAAVIGYVFAFLRIAAQPMTITPRCRQERPDTKPQKWEQVRVVQLRRFHQAASADTSHRQVNWQHSWVVRMHKVRQWYPSLGRHQVIFRGPYIKGPTDAPLLAGEKVQALVR
ncbi:hypothetical protein [Mycobacterium timonense]|uniref:Uncharacterized protein n=1 Tax=Mycobacterium timonense TaxID=701043 RepID=A0ABX3TE56_9MYCO|nr:hypothetical protein [Mycobacterium timonense]ORB77083.1 hypothetical protein BST46_26515 [Mycobacterium timonense]